MEEVSPWSRLGFGTSRNVEENKEMLLLRDQVIELSKQLADLTLRLERMERVNASEEKPIENVFAVADYSDFFGEETEDAPVIEDDVDDGITRVKTGFVAPPPKEVEEVAVEDIEPVGQSGDIDSEEPPIQKEFDEKEEEEIVAGICDMVEQYIEKNHGILNNQLKRRFTPTFPSMTKSRRASRKHLPTTLELRLTS